MEPALSPTGPLAAGVFGLTCLMLGVGALPPLRLDRTGAALIPGVPWLRP